MKHALALAALVAAWPALAHADATTYQGTLGDKQIVVEFSDAPAPKNAELFGRYFYVDQGVDIPLHATKGQRNRLGLAEEVACSEEANNCPHAQDETPSDPPLGAEWDLTVSDDGETIDGDFRLNGRNLPVKLERAGTREFDASTGLPGLQEFAMSLWYSGEVLTPETSPYDYLKVTSIKLAEGDIQRMTGGTFRYVTDPRTKFQYPRIVSLADGDPAATNAYLDQRHWRASLDALWCVSQQYQGFGWNGYNYDAGTLGWWDEEGVEVHYLTPTVMTWTEGGSLSCGGAHPYNHYEYYNLDVKTGAMIDLSRIFKGWVAKDFDGNPVDLETARANPTDYQWGPDEELLAFVNDHRPSNEELGFTGDMSDCPIDELIPQYMAISFKGDDIVHFGMDGMENVIVACASDLYDAPITELKDLLTPEAADYFPALKD
jgi:hypothetical protein